MAKKFWGAALLAPVLAACSGTRPDNLGIHEGQLLSCPPSPNCVSTSASTEEHQIAPLQAGQLSWRQVQAVVAAMPRTEIINSTDDYLYAECTSRLLRFVDDLELLRNTDGSIQVRSASRLGHSDLGVNRKRVEDLRRLLAEAQPKN